jgi:hypothetical protein
MKIITVNLPESYLKAIDTLIGDNALYPSRSELVRVAVREFLITELSAANNFTQFQSQIGRGDIGKDKLGHISELGQPIHNNLDDLIEQD